MFDVTALTPAVTVSKDAQAAAHATPDLLGLYAAVASGRSLSQAAGAAQYQANDTSQRVGVTVRATHVNAVVKRLGSIGFRVTASMPKLLYSLKELNPKSFSWTPEGNLIVILQAQNEQVSRIDLVVNFAEEIRAKMGAGK